MFHQDKAPVYKSALSNNGFESIGYLPYLSDLLPSDSREQIILL